MIIQSAEELSPNFWQDSVFMKINNRINLLEAGLAALNINVVENDTDIRESINALQNSYNEQFLTNLINANQANVNYFEGRFVNVDNIFAKDIYTENLIVNKPCFDITLNTPHLENTTSLGGNFYNPNLIGVKVSGMSIDINQEPVLSSAVLGYDANGNIIPVRAIYDVGFPENADYLFTDEFGTAFAGRSAATIREGTNLVQVGAVQNMYNDVNNSFNDVNNSFNDVNNSFNDVGNAFNEVNNELTNTSSAVNELLNILTVDISGWTDSSTPLNIQGIDEFIVSRFATPPSSFTDIGNGAVLNLNGTKLTLYIPGVFYEKENCSNMFYNCVNLNQNIQIPNNAIDCSSMFENCSILDYENEVFLLGFNQNIQIPNSVTNCSKLFANCVGFNQNIQIPNSVVNCSNMFYSCFAKNYGGEYSFEESYFNQNIQIPNSVVDCSGMFDRCSGFDQNILIPNSVVNCSSMFSSCTLYDDDNQVLVSGFNQNIQIPNSVVDCSRMFEVCYNLNQNIQIPNSVVDTSSMFSVCRNLNQNIQIPNSVTNCSNMFSVCRNLNQNIQIPNSVTNCSNMFGSCRNLNQNILIPNSVTNCSSMFGSCSNLNQNILIPNSVTNCSSMFGSCSNLNQNIQIPNSVVNCSGMFDNCRNLNQNILIPNSVIDCEFMFIDCRNLNQNIYIYSENITSLDSMFTECTLLEDKYIHIRSSIPMDVSNSIYNSLVNNSTEINWSGRVVNDLEEPTIWPPF